jgi:hypothetical protein
VSSYRSSATGRSRNTSGNRSYRTTQGKNGIDERNGHIIELDIDGEFSAMNLKATGNMFDMLQNAVSISLCLSSDFVVKLQSQFLLEKETESRLFCCKGRRKRGI